MQLFLTMLKQETTSSFSQGHKDPPLHKILLNPWWKWATLESWPANKVKSGNVVLLWTRRIFILIFFYNDLIDCNKVAWICVCFFWLFKHLQRNWLQEFLFIFLKFWGCSLYSIIFLMNKYIDFLNSYYCIAFLHALNFPWNSFHLILHA